MGISDITQVLDFVQDGVTSWAGPKGSVNLLTVSSAASGGGMF